MCAQGGCDTEFLAKAIWLATISDLMFFCLALCLDRETLGSIVQTAFSGFGGVPHFDKGLAPIEINVNLSSESWQQCWCGVCRVGVTWEFSVSRFGGTISDLMFCCYAKLLTQGNTGVYSTDGIFRFLDEPRFDKETRACSVIFGPIGAPVR